MKRNSKPKLVSYFLEEKSPSHCSWRFEDIDDPIAMLQRYYLNNKPRYPDIDLYDLKYPLLGVGAVRTAVPNEYSIELYLPGDRTIEFFILLFREG